MPGPTSYSQAPLQLSHFVGLKQFFAHKSGHDFEEVGSRVALSLRIRCDPNGLIYDETLFSLRWATLGSYPQL